MPKSGRPDTSKEWRDLTDQLHRTAARLIQGVQITVESDALEGIELTDRV